MSTTHEHDTTQIQAPPPAKPRKKWHQRWSVRIPALALVGLIAIIAASGNGSHAAASPAKPAPSTSAPAKPASPAPATSSPAPAKSAFQPQTLLTLSGNGSEDTASFTVPAGSGNWKIIWTYKEGDFGQNVNFAVTSEDFQANVNKLGPGGSGTEYVYGDPGTHHLSIISEGNWTVQVVTAP